MKQLKKIYMWVAKDNPMETKSEKISHPFDDIEHEKDLDFVVRIQLNTRASSPDTYCALYFIR